MTTKAAERNRQPKLDVDHATGFVFHVDANFDRGPETGELRITQRHALEVPWVATFRGAYRGRLEERTTTWIGAGCEWSTHFPGPIGFATPQAALDAALATDQIIGIAP